MSNVGRTFCGIPRKHKPTVSPILALNHNNSFSKYIVKALMHGNKNALSKVISPHCVTFFSFVVSFSYICTFHHIRENKFYTYLIYVLFFWCTAWKMFQRSSIFSSIFDKCSILLQTQSRQNHTSYRNFHFNEFVANALCDNIESKKKKNQALTSEKKMSFFYF